MNPEDLLYSDTHEWVRLEEEEGQRVATIGMTAFAVEQLTDLVYLELPEVGRDVAAGSEFGEVESVKAVSPLYCPVDGEVVAVNRELPDKLEVLSDDPYQAGWIVKVRLRDETSLAKLMDYAAYRNACLVFRIMEPRDEDRHVFTVRLTKLLKNQNLVLSLFAYVSPSDADAYLRPHVSYKLSDHLRVEAGGNVFFGNDDHTFFGQFENNTNVYVGARYAF